MKRLLLALLLAVAAARPAVAAAPAADYTDIWYNPAQSGYGYNLVQSDSFLFVTFFIFGPSLEPFWYTAELSWNGATAFTGPVYKSRGTYFVNAWNPAENSAIEVGSASFTPGGANNYQGTLAYSVSGAGAATHTLERQSLTSIATVGAYAGAQYGKYTGCKTPANNYEYANNIDLVVTQAAGGAVSYEFDFGSGLQCTLQGAYVQHGRYYEIPSAAYTCTRGLDAPMKARLYEIYRSPIGIEGRLYAQGVTDGCTESATFSAVFIP